MIRDFGSLCFAQEGSDECGLLVRQRNSLIELIGSKRVAGWTVRLVGRPAVALRSRIQAESEPRQRPKAIQRLVSRDAVFQEMKARWQLGGAPSENLLSRRLATETEWLRLESGSR